MKFIKNKSSILMVAGLFAIGIGGGTAYTFLTAEPEPDPEIVLQQDDTPGPDSIPEFNLELSSTVLEELIKKGDRYLLAGNYVSAGKAYEKAYKGTVSPSNVLKIRLALADEANGKYARAEKLFEAVSGNSSLSVDQQIARLALIRIWGKVGRANNALRAMADQILQADDINPDPEVTAQALYGFAHTLEEGAIESVASALERPLFFEFQPFDPSTVLELVDVANERLLDPPPPNNQPPIEDIEINQRAGDLVTLVVLSSVQRGVPTNRILQRLCEKSGFSINMPPALTQRLSSRSKSVAFRSLPLSVVLDAILAPLELTWIQEKEQVIIRDLKALKPGERDEAQLLAADRAYRQFALKFPEDSRFEAAMLARGNLNLLAGNTREAANFYELVKQRNPVDELLAKLNYNWGRLEAELGNFDSVEKLFVAADQSFNREIQTSSYELIAHLLLQKGKFEDAIDAAGRAVALAESDDQQRAAAITLAYAYLFNNEAVSANQALFSNRQQLRNQAQQSPLAVLGAYAHFLGVEDEHSKKIAESRLLGALTSPVEGETSFLADYVAGRAFQSLGFSDRAASEFKKAAGKATAKQLDEWSFRIRYAQAIEEAKMFQFKNAELLFLALADEDPETWGKRARIQLAKIYLENRMANESLKVSLPLLDLALEESEKENVLMTMGYAYRAIELHHSAALCFAGVFPQSDEVKELPDNRNRIRPVRIEDPRP